MFQSISAIVALQKMIGTQCENNTPYNDLNLRIDHECQNISFSSRLSRSYKSAELPSNGGAERPAGLT